MNQAELISKLKNGDEAAFTALYELYVDDLFRHLYYLLGNRETAEDLLHEVMMMMIEKINFYTPRPDLKNSFKAWLYRLATNRAIDELRKKKNRIEEEFAIVIDPSLGQEELYQNKEQEKRLGDLLLQLPLMQRMCLSLRVNEDLSYQEISLVISRDINTIKQGIFQARRSLKNLLQEQGEWI